MKAHTTGFLLFACSIVASVPTLGLAATADASNVPAMHCQKPTPLPKKGLTAPMVDTYNEALPKYRKCVADYVDARGAAAKKYSALAQANAKAANEAVSEFNAFVKSVSSAK